jgi:hypothetical protein
MNELLMWLSRQHHGLHTFRRFQQRLAKLCKDEPEQKALYGLLHRFVGNYIDAFDEEPVPVAVADRAYDRLQKLLASLDPGANAGRRLADLNRVASSDLWRDQIN